MTAPPSPASSIELAGTGAATLEQNAQRRPYRYAPKEVAALLNELYRIRFFDLPSRYNAKSTIFLRDDGSIGTSVLRTSDAASTSVCFAVGAYRKCVTYGNDSPLELESFVQRRFVEAQQLANQQERGR